MTPFSFLSALRASPFLGILRDIRIGQVSGIAKASHSASLHFIEVTMNTPGAHELIGALRHACAPLGIEVGAGTVRTVDELQIATEAGAQFIVAPCVIPEVIKECARLSLPCLPGALTPTEIQQAYMLGATCVKVFPVKALGGPAYIKELRGPYRDIPLLACGGVGIDNCEEYFVNGVDAVAFGASIFKQEWMTDGSFDKVEAAIRKLRESAKK